MDLSSILQFDKTVIKICINLLKRQRFPNFYLIIKKSLIIIYLYIYMYMDLKTKFSS